MSTEVLRSMIEELDITYATKDDLIEELDDIDEKLDGLPPEEPYKPTWLFTCQCGKTWTQNANGHETMAPLVACSGCGEIVKAGF